MSAVAWSSDSLAWALSLTLEAGTNDCEGLKAWKNLSMTNNVRSEVYDGIVQFDTAAISNLTGHDSRFLVHQWVHLYHLHKTLSNKFQNLQTEIYPLVLFSNRCSIQFAWIPLWKPSLRNKSADVVLSSSMWHIGMKPSFSASLTAFFTRTRPNPLLRNSSFVFSIPKLQPSLKLENNVKCFDH